MGDGGHKDHQRFRFLGMQATIAAGEFKSKCLKLLDQVACGGSRGCTDSELREPRLVLAQITTDAKSNEITAVPKLLEMLALKGNQGKLHEDVVLLVDDPACKAATAAPVVEADYGRIETRTATVSTEIDWLQKQHQWPGLKAIGKVERVCETPDKTTTETAYYLLSAVLMPERFNDVVRQHWGVENRLH